MSNVFDRLQDQINRMQNPTVLGLDPKLDYIPAFIKSDLENEGYSGETLIEEMLFRFNQGLIDATYDIIPAVKPQLAYYELYAEAGMKALYRTISYARDKGMIVIADGKRNDIGSTSDAYAKAWLGRADLLTVNAYLGSDGILPFVEQAVAADAGVFALVRTSNPSAAEFQDLTLADGRKLYEAVADQVELWNANHYGKAGFGPVGSVVGATWPEQARALRERMPHSFFLVPGYGAQGATAEDCAANFNERGEGAIVNSSRGLMLAYKKSEIYGESEYAQACRDEAIAMREALKAALN